MDNRQTFIGGSDVAAIVGCSRYQTPMGLWRLKTGRETQADRALFRIGHHMEGFILSEYSRQGGQILSGIDLGDGRHIEAQVTTRHPRETWAGATVDALYVRRDEHGERIGILDAKFSRISIDANDADSLPYEWVLQMHHYGWVMGLRHAELAVCNYGAGCEVTVYPLALDLEWYEAAVVPRLADFWERVVFDAEPESVAFVERDPPPELPAEGESAARRYIQASEAEKAAAAAKEAARDDLMAVLGAAGNPKKATAGAFRVGVSLCNGRAGFDQKRLEAENPEIFARYQKLGAPYSTLRVTERA